jgi:hypothetical protein
VLQDIIVYQLAGYAAPDDVVADNICGGCRVDRYINRIASHIRSLGGCLYPAACHADLSWPAEDAGKIDRDIVSRPGINIFYLQDYLFDKPADFGFERRIMTSFGFIRPVSGVDQCGQGGFKV